MYSFENKLKLGDTSVILYNFTWIPFEKQKNRVTAVLSLKWGQGPGPVGSALDCQPLGPGFDSWPGSLCWMTVSSCATSALRLIVMVPGCPISPYRM